jgi:hypothetical protein
MLPAFGAMTAHARTSNAPQIPNIDLQIAPDARHAAPKKTGFFPQIIDNLYTWHSACLDETKSSSLLNKRSTAGSLAMPPSLYALKSSLSCIW